MVIKFVIRYLFTLSKIATIKENGKQQVLVRIQRNRNPRAQLEGKENDASALANSLAVLQRIKHRVALWPSNSMPRDTPERSENMYPQKNLARNVRSSIINNSEEVKTAHVGSAESWKIWNIWAVLLHGRSLQTLLKYKKPDTKGPLSLILGFPGSSVDKESACNAGEPGSIPGLRRSPAEGIGYSLQYSWASPVAQLVKNPPAMWGT